MSTSVSMEQQAPVAERNRKLGMKLGMLVLFMVAMAPVMYVVGDTLCDIVGLGQNPNAGAEAAAGAGTGRQVKVIFGAQVHPSFGDKLSFEAVESTQRMEVGVIKRNQYVLRNLSPETLYIRPIHHVSPPNANRKFLMTECFCFNDMALKPFETVELPVAYDFQKDMDIRVNEALVSYTLDPITLADLRARREMPTEGNWQPKLQAEADSSVVEPAPAAAAEAADPEGEAAK